ncbi:MAG: hypothetical protein AMXMBFR82_35510 [Candidatus Hydrogenedentota bacterium]
MISFAALLMVMSVNTGAELSYLERTANAVDACRQQIPAMQSPADSAAKRLAEGGALWAAGHSAWVSELSGRAGGMMLIKNLGDATPAAGDVVLFAQVEGVELPASVLESGAFIVGFGARRPNDSMPWFANPAADAEISPTLGNVIPGWIFTAELVSALTRLGKMPVMYETIGLPGGYPRIYKFQREGIFWHEPHDVKPIDASALGNQYADAVNGILRRANVENRRNFATAGTWAAEALSGGHQVFMYCMGHFVPDEVGKTVIGEDFTAGVWNSGFTNLQPPSGAYNKGDVLIHIGYQHPPRGLLDAGRAANARVLYVDILRDRDFVDDSGVIWIDPMWSWPDACVTVEGYDIPILPPSGIVNSAIAWEIHRITRENLAP